MQKQFRHQVQSIALSSRQKILHRIYKDLENTIPYTVSDVNKWANKKDGKETFSQFIGKSGVTGSEQPQETPQQSSIPAGWDVKVK